MVRSGGGVGTEPSCWSKAFSIARYRDRISYKVITSSCPESPDGSLASEFELCKANLVLFSGGKEAGRTLTVDPVSGVNQTCAMKRQATVGRVSCFGRRFPIPGSLELGHG
jgi:hypothetical protein